MSGLFDRIKSGAGQAAFEVEKMRRINAVQSEIKALEGQIGQTFYRIGHIGYELYSQGRVDQPELQDACNQLAMLQEQVVVHEREIEKIRSEVFVDQPKPTSGLVCPQGHGPLPTSGGFCPSCGSPGVPVHQPEPVAAFCPHCRAGLASGATFCAACGTKVVQAAPPAVEPSPPPSSFTSPPPVSYEPPPSTIPQAPVTKPAERRCPNCSAELVTAAKFCPDCGWDVSRVQAPPSPGPEPAKAPAVAPGEPPVAPPVTEAPGAAPLVAREHRCPSCGAHLIPEAVYCPDCGENVAGTAAVRPATPTFESPMAPPVAETLKTAEPAVGGHRCPSCGALLIPEAVYCPDCGENVAGIAAARPASPASEPPVAPPVAETPQVAEPAVHERRCLECGTQLIPEAIFCPECGTSVPAASEAAPAASPASPATDEWVFPDEEPSLPEPEADVRHCQNCGAELIPEALFCPECGFDVRTAVEQSDEIGTADLGVDLSSDQPEEE